MDDENFAKLLLESSFKESNAFWIRNSVFLLAQSWLLGLAVGKDSEPETIIVFAGFGILLALLHWGALKISKYYNDTWFKAFRSWVDCKAPPESTDEESPSDESSNSWSHLRSTLTKHENLPFPFMHATCLMYFLPVLFIAAWLFLSYFACLELLCAAANAGD